MKNILEQLEKNEALNPTALLCGDENEDITYHEMLLSARKAGAFLSEHTPTRKPVALYVEKSVPVLVGFFSIVYAGCFYSVLDPSQPPSRTAMILEKLAPKVVISTQENKEKIEEIISNLCDDNKPELLILEDIPGIKDRHCTDNCQLSNEEEQKLQEIRTASIDVDPLYVNFTSGSTGVPKGVLVSHRSVLSFINDFVNIFGINKDDILGNQAPFDFDVSVKDIYSAIFTGCKVQLIPRGYFSNPTKLMDYLVEKEITNLTWAVSALCFVSIMNGLEYKVPTTIKRIMFSGEVMPIKHLNHIKKFLPDAMYVNLYGPTEITCNCTYYIIDKDFEEGERIPIGNSFPTDRVFLLGEDGKEILPTEDNTGEILVSGAGLAIGYYNDPEKTNSAFIQNPLNNLYYERCYLTGDLGKYNSDGELVYLSRKDFQIKRMGHRIELGEIENTVMKLDEITRACALYEQDTQKLFLFYTGTIEKKLVAKLLREMLPIYMIPTKTFMLEEMPLTKNGKIDRKALAEMAK